MKNLQGKIRYSLIYFWRRRNGPSRLKRTPRPEDFINSAAPQQLSHVISHDKNADGEHTVTQWFFPTMIPTFPTFLLRNLDFSLSKLKWIRARSKFFQSKCLCVATSWDLGDSALAGTRKRTSGFPLIYRVLCRWYSVINLSPLVLRVTSLYVANGRYIQWIKMCRAV